MAWQKVKLGDLYEVHNGLSKGGKFFGSGYPFLSFSTVFNNWFIPQNIKDFVQSTDKEQESYSIKKGDVFITRTSETADELGMSCVALKDYPQATYNGFCKRLRPIKSNYEVNPRYIGYYLRTSDFRGKFLGLSGTMTTRASLRNEDLLAMEILLPPLKEQERIANVLSAYDDLIENNQKQIKLLEEAAQRLYKQWFIDLKFPGHETTKIVDGLPEGWEKEKIDAVYNIKYGKNLPKTEIKDVGKYPVYGANGIIGYYDSPNCFQKVVLITSRGNGSGDVGCTKHKESFVTNNSFIVLPNKSYNYYGFSFIYGQMNAMDFHSITTGSAQPQLTNNSISTLNVNVPPQELITNFSGIVDNYYEKIDILYNQMFCLQIARDRLLPKLMSDELEV